MFRATILVITAFAVVILAGTLVLSLPISTVDGGIDPLDAFFTSTSAVCVTGLIVVDTAGKFTFFGQLTILALIQLGGLGVITYSAIVLVFAGRRLTLLQREVLSTAHAGTALQIDIRQIGKPVIIYVFVLESLGAVVLFFAFLRYFPVEQAFYHAVFHSVSAFCNAGFSTFRTSLMNYAGDWFVCMPIMVLIVTGGLGFVVVLDLYETYKFRKPLYLHTRLVAVTTIVLIVLGAVVFFLLENENILRGRPIDEQVLGSLFASVTCRTAGFNTVDYAALTQGSLMVTILFMVIGGSPGSTAGGIKTTAIAIIVLTAIARVKGKETPEFANRSIAQRSVADAITLTTISTVFILMLIMALQVTENGSVPHHKVTGALMELSFEGVSAFGTVGLSMGATAGLTVVGKFLIIIAMFIGRLGPLTFFSLLGRGGAKKQQYRLYSESVMVG